MKRNETLQALCRSYLEKLRYMATKHGLLPWVDETVKANRRHECEATEKEVEMLSRLCDDERVARVDVPKLLGKSYRQCFDDGDFDKIKKLPREGIYGKVSTLLYADKIKNKKRNNKRK
jgi:hypothetical protein